MLVIGLEFEVHQYIVYSLHSTLYLIAYNEIKYCDDPLMLKHSRYELISLINNIQLIYRSFATNSC